ncbi:MULTISPECIES: hypothetical protein [Bacillus]|uniref:hypothetical protein n=1 Tax=Bacillus TaxID=1386 RepID=UPI00077AA52B|nr:MULTISPECIES: hypothetical protein [Bacillus]KAB2372925.1 hypothetical protein F8510_24450 [Bacillus sp. RM2(2019)]KXY66847.1 hypothetical protein AT261_11540 [Bacillus cereus]PEV15082.1 hypothetical protein CN418_14840 [Bacillus thuringiensis]
MKSEKSTFAEKVQSIKGKTVAKYGTVVFLFFGLTSCYNQKNDRLSSQVELYREKSEKLAKEYDELETNYIKLTTKLDAIENPPKEKPAEVDIAEEKPVEKVEETPIQDTEPEKSEEETLKEEQYATREKKAYANLNSLGSSEAQETYKELIKPKLSRWASKDMLQVAKEGVKFREIDDSNLPWTDATEPNGTSTRHIYKSGYDQLEITYNFDGTITKSEWKIGVNK